MYIRLCETLDNVGKLVPSSDLINYIKDQNKDYYNSIYLYTEEQKNRADEIIEVEKKGKMIQRPRGVAGMTDVITHKLVWDFDSSDLELARTDTIELLNRLENYGLNTSTDVNICFSGSKGFSVEINTTDTFTPKEFKSIVHTLASDLESFDPKIVNPSRIFRIPFTKHQSTGLYKTPLSRDELSGLTLEEIKDLASKQLPIDSEYLSYTVDIPKSIADLRLVRLAKKKLELAPVDDLELHKKPVWLSNWKYAISRGYFKEGTRSYALTILAATCRNAGFSKTQAFYFLVAAAEEQSKRFNSSKFPEDEIQKNIIDVVYGDNWQGGSWSEDNFPEDLKEFLVSLDIPKDNRQNEGELIETVYDGFGEFISYAKDIEKNTIKFGVPSIDKHLKIRKGHMIGLIAPPGVGKTSFAITLANNMSLSNSHVYFASYDMYKNNVYQKLIQRHTGLNDDDIYKAFINRDTETIESFRNVLQENYGNVTFCFKTGQSLGELKRSIRDSENRTGKFVDLVIVDYIELLLTEASDPTSSTAEAAQGLREIANEGRVVLLLLQPNKMNSKPNKPLTSYNSAKGSSAIAQAVTSMLTLHRPGLHSRLHGEDNFIGLDCVKNRNGPLFSLDFYWQGKTQTFSELDQIGKVRLEQVRQMVYDLENEDEERENF